MRTIDSFTGDYACFSNFHRMVVPCNIRRERFFFTEVAFQALKATDTSEFRKIMVDYQLDPGGAKRAGRNIKINVKNWDKIKDGIMYMLLEMKFFSNPGFAEILKGTGNAKLVEGNRHHDNYWGDCQCGRSACEEKGKNMLGKLLMRVRSEVQTFYPAS